RRGGARGWRVRRDAGSRTEAGDRARVLPGTLPRRARAPSAATAGDGEILDPPRSRTASDLSRSGRSAVMNLGRPDRADALAAEYVLGTLRGRARQRFDRAVRADRVLGDAVQRWEDRLLPLAEGLPPVNPPGRVWRAIQARIGSAPASRMTFWSSLGWWRGLALVSLAAVVALSVLLLRPGAERAEGAVVAVLAGSDAKAALVASADRFGRYLTIKAISRIDVPADRSLQL